MYIVYSDNENEKKILEEEFQFHSDHFNVPLNNVKTLHDLIGRTYFEFYQNIESVFIEKFKTFITELIDMKLSFPLLRELLTIAKRKDLASKFYRSHFVAIDNFFHDGEDSSGLFEDEDCPKQMSIIEEELEQSYLSCKSLESFEMDTDPIITLESIAESEQLGYQKHYFHEKDEKISIFLSDYTADETIETLSHTIDSQKNHLNNHIPSDTQTQAPPLKNKKSFQTNLFTMWDTNVSKGKNLIHEETNESMEEYINSFRKEKTGAVVEMIINDESLSKIARKELKDHKERKKLEEEIIQKTKYLKSNEYNSKIKNVLLNNKLNQKRSRSASAFKKGRTSNLENAKEIGNPEKIETLCLKEKDFSSTKVNLINSIKK